MGDKKEPKKRNLMETGKNIRMGSHKKNNT